MSFLLEAIFGLFSFMLYVATQGAFFGEKFRKNYFIKFVLLCVLLVSFFFLAKDVWEFIENKPAEAPKILSSAEEYFSRGSEFRQKSEPQKAYSDFDQAILLNGKHCPSIKARAEIDLEMRRFESAIEGFRMAKNCNPSDKSIEGEELKAVDAMSEKSLAPLWSEMQYR